MSLPAPLDKGQDTRNAAPERDGSHCHIFTTYSFSTQIHYQPMPQPTPVHTFILAEGRPLPGPAPSQETPYPPILQKRNPWPDVSSKDSSAGTTNLKARPASEAPASFPWQDVFAVPLVTSLGDCPTKTSSPTPKTLSATTQHTSDHDINAAHKVNIHLAILVGGLTVGIVVISILIAVVGCIIFTRRRKRRAKVGKQLSDVDDTLTYQSNNTVGTCRTTMSERRLKCQTGWQMKEFMHQGLYSPFGSSAVSPSSGDKIEILARSGTTSDPFIDRTSHWGRSTHPTFYANRSESLSDSCSTDAPSYFPGDDIRYTNMPQSSTSALTEVSCAATIDSNSNSVCATRLNPPTPQPSDFNTSPTVTANLSSLIKHKAFVSSMMSEPISLQSIDSDPLHPTYLSPPKPVVTSTSRPQSTQSVADSVYSDGTNESMYWINRPKS